MTEDELVILAQAIRKPRFPVVFHVAAWLMVLGILCIAAVTVGWFQGYLPTPQPRWEYAHLGMGSTVDTGSIVGFTSPDKIVAETSPLEASESALDKAYHDFGGSGHASGGVFDLFPAIGKLGWELTGIEKNDIGAIYIFKRPANHGSR